MCHHCGLLWNLTAVEKRLRLMKGTILLAFTSVSLALGVPCMMGSLINQTAIAQTPIRELQRNSGVTISGTVKSVVGNEFTLNDGTGEIIVDPGPRWWKEINLTPGEQVTVVGEYDDYDFDAFSITRSSGEVIQIRNGPGRPPWAGGRNR